MDFDGCSELFVNSWDDLERFFTVSGTTSIPLKLSANSSFSLERGVCESLASRRGPIHGPSVPSVCGI